MKIKHILHFMQLGQRQNQQDRMLISSDRRLFVICDGMGGSHNGAFASEKLVEILEMLYERGVNGHPEVWLKKMIIEANEALFKSCDIQNQNGSGTTLALLYLNNNDAYVSHIGDSKVFFIKPHEQKWWCTKDHSFVQELLDAGILASEQETKSHPMRSRITQAITDDQILSLDLINVQHFEGIRPEDIFILCTDGVVEKLLSEDLVTMFVKDINAFENNFIQLKEYCQELSRDNNTAIGIQI